ncbi:hypothetical protein MRB53_014201 [Persea americana]|uniref:Uncharacterized protein n=1 Tax=Persea americana TaxID=3435 RepID=A0ACC2KA77_PERAE|nr:hypothetical protein MRB53_014201 [Persea americana]
MSTFQQLPLYTVMAHHRSEPRSVLYLQFFFYNQGSSIPVAYQGSILISSLAACGTDVRGRRHAHDRSGYSHPSILSDKAQTVQILSCCNSIQSLSCLCLLIFLNQRGSDKHYSRFQQSVWPTSNDPPINS